MPTSMYPGRYLTSTNHEGEGAIFKMPRLCLLDACMSRIVECRKQDGAGR